MAGTMNKVMLIGNLGKDPETRNFENGGAICSFPIATTDSYWDREKNQRVDLPTEWHNIRVSKPGLVKVAQTYLKKGNSVYVEGKIRNRQYQTKEGETRYTTEIVVEELILLGKAPGENVAPAPAQHFAVPEAVLNTPQPDDDLPF
jgi:single-strand DNA-binding protein